jgi:serine/threonine protein phosphatase 1
MSQRTIAIGDIHGCSLALDALLRAVVPCSQDVIVTLGDYINRGSDSRGVLDQLIALIERCRLFPLLGNHEQKLLEARAGIHPTTWLGMGGTATLDSYGPGRDLSLIPDEHFEFLESCLECHETDEHIFVHANYYPSLPMDEQPVLMLRWESLGDTIPEPHESGKTVIAGHTPQQSGEILDLGFLKCIDTNCWGGGWLTALEVSTGEVWQANREGRLRERA